MAEITINYRVDSEYLRGIIWHPIRHECNDRQSAEQYYDNIVRLERAYGTPRNPRMMQRVITISSWSQVERHAS